MAPVGLKITSFTELLLESCYFVLPASAIVSLWQIYTYNNKVIIIFISYSVSHKSIVGFCGTPWSLSQYDWMDRDIHRNCLRSSDLELFIHMFVNKSRSTHSNGVIDASSLLICVWMWASKYLIEYHINTSVGHWLWLLKMQLKLFMLCHSPVGQVDGTNGLWNVNYLRKCWQINTAVWSILPTQDHICWVLSTFSSRQTSKGPVSPWP